MNANKICTDLEQSKTLQSLGIDRKTSDMFYWYGEDIIRVGGDEAQSEYFDIPAWSLSALLELIPNYVINKADDKIYANLYYDFKSSHDNLVDAAFEMICRLKENNKI